MLPSICTIQHQDIPERPSDVTRWKVYQSLIWYLCHPVMDKLHSKLLKVMTGSQRQTLFINDNMLPCRLTICTGLKHMQKVSASIVYMLTCSTANLRVAHWSRPRRIGWARHPLLQGTPLAGGRLACPGGALWGGIEGLTSHSPHCRVIGVLH